MIGLGSAELIFNIELWKRLLGASRDQGLNRGCVTVRLLS